MFRRNNRFLVVVAALVAGLLSTATARPQAAPKPRPHLEAVAETRLLMEGIAQPNFRGLEKRLRQEPADAESWSIVRGQALLLAESGNLLLLRPPHNPGESAWQDRAGELRSAATRLARSAAERDYPRSRAGLVEVANVCNRCHQTFRVPLRLQPFADPPAQKTDTSKSSQESSVAQTVPAVPKRIVDILNAVK